MSMGDGITGSGFDQGTFDEYETFCVYCENEDTGSSDEFEIFIVESGCDF